MKRVPCTSSHSNLRVFTACLLSFLMLLAPVATLAGPANAAEAANAAAEARRKLTADQKMESFLFNAPLPAATPDMSATMTDAFADGDGDLKAEFGETITYTADIINDGPVDATGVSFNSTIDPNTEFVSGSVKVSPLAFNDSYVATKDTPLTGGASLLTNDTGKPNTPTLVVSAVVGCADVTAPFDNCATTAGGQVDVNADGTFTYDPPSGFEGSDSFNYTISNGVTPPNPGVDDTATVTFNVDAAPTVTATTPADNALGVDPTSNISVTFSEPVNVTGTWFTISCTTSGTHTATVTGGPTTFTLNPDTDLVGNETCTVTIVAAQVTDQDSNDPPDQMAADYVFDFQTDAAPAVTTTSPTNGAVGVATNVNVVINFSENITHTASAFKIECPAPGNLKTFVATGSGTNQITLNPTADLPAGTTCTVTVDKDEISDSDAFDPPDNMVADYVFSFTTDAAPAVTTTSPTNGAANLPTNTTITVNFSENVNATTNSFKIECPAPGNLQTFSLSASPSNTFTLTPTTSLPGGVTCTVTVIAAQITDQDGNDPPDNMVADYVFTFSTDAAPSVTATTPINGATQQANNTNVTVTFSESVTLNGNWFSIVCGTSGTHDTTNSTVTGGPSTYTINPTDFANGETCTATVFAAQVEDTDSFDPPNNMVANFVFSFTIDVPPTVQSTTPTNGATGVAANTNITVVFSEAVTTTAGAFDIQCPAGSGTIAKSLSGSGTTTIVLDPTANLPVGAECTVTITAAQVSDVDAGDPPDTLAADYVFTFKIPPVANDDTHPQNVIGNVNVNSANIPFSVTTNDQFAAADQVVIDQVQGVTTVVTNTITATTAQGGTVVVTVSGADRGKYLYNPPAGYEGNDSFTYQITNDGGSDTATVTLPISGMVWFVNNGGPVGDGRLSSPFNSLAAFQAVNNGAGNNPAINDNIFIYQNASAYTGPVTLLSGQRLIGQDSTQSLAVRTGLTPPSGSAPFPTVMPADGVIVKITTSAATTNAIELNNIGGNNEIYGLTVGNTTGVGISGIPAGAGPGVAGFGSLTVADVSIDDTSTRTGQALLLTKGTTGAGTVTATFGAFESSSAVNGLNLTNIGGTITINNGVMSTLTGADFLVSGGGATITYNGTITNAAGEARSIDVQNKTGGTVDFNGLVSDSGTGITFLNNASTAIRFDGGLILNTATSNAFVATSNGSIAITDPNANGTAPDNTITTTTGTPINIAFTNIDANGITFRSITANGSTNGIVLNTTGTGPFTVTGNGDTGPGGVCTTLANCSGGSIRATTNDGVSLTAASNVSLSRMFFENIADNTTNAANCDLDTATGCAAAVDMQSATSNVTLDRIVIDGNDGIDGAGGANAAGQIGISGHQVNGLIVTNAIIKNVGESNEESGVLITDAQGTVKFEDVTITDPAEYGIRFYKLANTTLNLTVRRVTVQQNISTFGEQGFSIRADGGTSNVLVDDCDFLNTDGIGVDGQAINAAILNLTVQGSVFTENRSLPMAVNFTTDNTSQGFVKIDNNTINDCATPADCSVAIDIDANRTSTLHAIITNNSIPTGTGIGTGIEFIVGDGATGRAEVRDNNVTVNSGEIGMTFAARNEGFGGTNGRLDVTFEGNTVNGIASAGLFNPGVQFLAGASTGTHDQDFCVNTHLSHNAGGNTINGTNTPGLTPRFEVTQRTGTTFLLQGFTGTGTLDTSVAAHFNSNNNAGTLDPTFVRPAGGTAIVNYTAGTCNLPTTPTLPPLVMIQPETNLRGDLARTDDVSQPASQLEIIPAGKLIALGGETIAHHTGAAAKPAAVKSVATKSVATKPAAQKVAEPIARQTNTLETVKTAGTQTATRAQTKPSVAARTAPAAAPAAETFTSHARSKPKAQPQASNVQPQAQGAFGGVEDAARSEGPAGREGRCQGQGPDASAGRSAAGGRPARHHRHHPRRQEGPRDLRGDGQERGQLHGHLRQGLRARDGHLRRPEQPAHGDAHRPDGRHGCSAEHGRDRPDRHAC